MQLKLNVAEPRMRLRKMKGGKKVSDVWQVRDVYKAWVIIAGEYKLCLNWIADSHKSELE